MKNVFNKMMSRYPTLMGVIALFYWALLGSFVCSLVTIPPYEILTFVYFISFILSVYYFKLDWHALCSREFCIMLLMVSSCLYLNDFFLTEMYKLIEPGIASMVFYCSWPTLSILGIVLFNNAKCSYTNIMGIMMTFSALFYLIYNEYVQNMIHLNFYYLFPVFSAFFWGLHNVLTKQYQIKRYDFMIFVYFFGGCLALILHLQFETFQSPGIKDVMFLFLLGTTSHFFAYLMWIEGIKRGDAKKLLSLGYFNPVLSVFLLAMFGYTPLTSLVIICSLIMATGCYLANQKH